MILCIASMLSVPAARADVLWYNGDYDNRDSLLNENNVPINTGMGTTIQFSTVYDNFVVPVGQVWTITGVFSDNQMNYAIPATTATWGILTGLVPGNFDSEVAFDDTDATQVALSPVPGFFYAAPEYRVTASVPSLVLTAGTYWLTVVPDSAGFQGDDSFIETTSGANAVGTPPGNDGDSFVFNTFPPPPDPDAFFATPTTVALDGDGDGDLIDFSMGIIGTAAVVPEPSSVALLVVGLMGSLAWAKKRRRALAG
jgi:hypothetical protein